MTKKDKSYRTPPAVARLKKKSEKRPQTQGVILREEPVEISERLQWFAIATEERSERTAALRIKEGVTFGRPEDDDPTACYLKGDGADVYLPSEQVEIVFRRVKIMRYIPTFTGYVFVGAHDPDALFARCAKVRGVIEAIGGWERPRQIKVEHLQKVERWLTGAQRVVVLPKFAFRKGQIVRVIEGPFQQFEGVVDKHDPHGITKVLVDIFGRPTPVELAPGQFEGVD